MMSKKGIINQIKSMQASIHRSSKKASIILCIPNEKYDDNNHNYLYNAMDNNIRIKILQNSLRNLKTLIMECLYSKDHIILRGKKTKMHPSIIPSFTSSSNDILIIMEKNYASFAPSLFEIVSTFTIEGYSFFASFLDTNEDAIHYDMLPILSVSIGDYEICTKAQIDLEFVDLQELYFLLYTCKIQPVRKFLPGLKNVIENVENQLRIDDKITRKKKKEIANTYCDEKHMKKRINGLTYYF